MSVNVLAGHMGDACYGFLAVNFLWGLYCVILLWRRILRLRFIDERTQAEFLHTLQQMLEAGDFEAAKKMCVDEPRALPQLALAVIENRDLSESQLRQLVAELMQRNVLADLEYRLSWVATVIKSGPLLGLFGTVLGMMAAFGRIGTGEKVQPYADRQRNRIALDLHRHGTDHRHSLYLLAGQLEHPHAHPTGLARLRDDPIPGAFQACESMIEN